MTRNARLTDAEQALRDALRSVAALDADAEAIPYPLKVRFRVAILRAAVALAAAEEPAP